MRDFSSGEVPMGPHLEQDILKLAFQKRDCYAYEDEWRAALYENPCPYDGLDIDFDLDQLVCEVYVGPRAEDFFYEAVRAIMERFQLDKPLMRSTLLRGPQRAEPVCP
jgi:hypothetical protein